MQVVCLAPQGEVDEGPAPQAHHGERGLWVAEDGVEDAVGDLVVAAAPVSVGEQLLAALHGAHAHLSLGGGTGLAQGVGRAAGGLAAPERPQRQHHGVSVARTRAGGVICQRS